VTDTDVFLSYCRADRELAERFVETAKAHGLSVWFDENIEGGRDWREVIVTALSSAKALVILFSDHSNASTQLIKELAVADSMRKLVIPVLVSDCEPSGPYLYELASRNWIRIHPDPETRLASLVGALMAELDLHVAQASAGPQVAPTPVIATSAAPSLVPQAAEPSGRGIRERWLSVHRYDAYVLVPSLVAEYLAVLFEKGDNGQAVFGISIMVAFGYTIVMGVRNARANRSIWSWQSFAPYLAIGFMFLAPAGTISDSDNNVVIQCIAALVLAAAFAIPANICQAVLRSGYQKTAFRGRTIQPLQPRR
jgi:hypothetical protein